MIEPAEEIMSYETILYEIKKCIAIITLNRSEALNAWNDQMAVDLSKTLKQSEENNEVRAVVVTGKGRAFCAGTDLSHGSFISKREKKKILVMTMTKDCQAFLLFIHDKYTSQFWPL